MKPETKYTIAEHWDTGGFIQKDADPQAEFDLWYEASLKHPDWTGEEFTVQDFKDYIASL